MDVCSVISEFDANWYLLWIEAVSCDGRSHLTEPVASEAQKSESPKGSRLHLRTVTLRRTPSQNSVKSAERSSVVVTKR